jgi:hypothetical protein
MQNEGFGQDTEVRVVLAGKVTTCAVHVCPFHLTISGWVAAAPTAVQLEAEGQVTACRLWPGTPLSATQCAAVFAPVLAAASAMPAPTRAVVSRTRSSRRAMVASLAVDALWVAAARSACAGLDARILLLPGG